MIQFHLPFFKARLKTWITNPWKIAQKIRSLEDLRYTIQVGNALSSPIKKFLSSKRSLTWDIKPSLPKYLENLN